MLTPTTSNPTCRHEGVVDLIPNLKFFQQSWYVHCRECNLKQPLPRSWVWWNHLIIYPPNYNPYNFIQALAT